MSHLRELSPRLAQGLPDYILDLVDILLAGFFGIKRKNINDTFEVGFRLHAAKLKGLLHNAFFLFFSETSPFTFKGVPGFSNFFKRPASRFGISGNFFSCLGLLFEKSAHPHQCKKFFLLLCGNPRMFFDGLFLGLNGTRYPHDYSGDTYHTQNPGFYRRGESSKTARPFGRRFGHFIYAFSSSLAAFGGLIADLLR